MRRKKLCDRNLCRHEPGECPLDRLEEAQSSEAGQLLRRALDIKALINIGLPISLDEIDADEMFAMLIIEEEQNRFEEEELEKS